MLENKNKRERWKLRIDSSLKRKKQSPIRVSPARAILL